jgi:hypothetical protein
VRVNPWYTTTLDVALVAALLRWRPNGLSDIKFRQLAKRTACVLLAWLSVGLPAAYAMGTYSDTILSDAGEVIGDGRIVVLEPETWIGKRFPLLDYIDIGDRLAEGRWFVLLYHNDCPDCRRAIRNLSRKMTPGRDNPRVALIEVPPYGNANAKIRLSETSFVHGRLRDEREWFVVTPAHLELNAGKVVPTSPDHVLPSKE